MTAAWYRNMQDRAQSQRFAPFDKAQYVSAARLQRARRQCERVLRVANALEARAIYRATRALHLPRAPLDGAPHKALAPAALTAFAKRYFALGQAGMRAELDALLRGEQPVQVRKTRASRTRTQDTDPWA